MLCGARSLLSTTATFLASQTANSKQQTARSQGQPKALCGQRPLTNLRKQEHAKGWELPGRCYVQQAQSCIMSHNKSLISPLCLGSTFTAAFISTDHPHLPGIVLGHMLHLWTPFCKPPMQNVIVVPMMPKRQVPRLEMAVKYTQIMHYPTFFLPKPNFLVLKCPNTAPQVPRGQVPYTCMWQSAFGSK